MKKEISNIRNILTRYEQRKFMILIFLNALLSIADIGSIALIFVVLNIYSGQPLEWLSPILYEFNIEQQSLLPGILLIVIFILKSLAGYFISKAQHRFIANVATRIAGKSLLLYLEGSYEDHVSIDSAVWMRRVCFQSAEFAQYVLSALQQLINELILIIISITALALYNIKLLAIVSVVLLPAIIILSYITKKRLAAARKNIKASNEISLQYLNEAISGFVESNIYNKNAFFVKRYMEGQFAVNRLIADMHVTQVMPSRFFEVFAVTGFLMLIIFIKFFGNENSVNILMLGAFVAAAYKIIPGISKIISFIGQIRTYFFTASELAKQKNITLPKPPGTLDETIDSIEMRNIQFAYSDTIVFEDLNCIIKKNSFIGLSGNSGKGKTTLIDLLLGFLSPGAGAILINDKQVSDNEIRKFWPQVAYVKQSTFLLHDSILHNITLYKEHIDQKKLEEVLDVTGLNDWLCQLPGGVNTIITENGKNISGGQRQRIAIARALFKNAPLTILDEPFNELDEVSEISLLNYFKQLSLNGKTILLVTHNTNSFNFCDNTIYLDENKA